MKTFVIGTIIVILDLSAGFIFYKQNQANKTPKNMTAEKTSREYTSEEKDAIAIAQIELLKHYPDGKINGEPIVFQDLVHSLRRDPSISVIFAPDSAPENGISIEVDMTSKNILYYNGEPVQAGQ